MNVATDFDRDRSLEAMWQAFRASSFAHQQLVAIDTGVVRDLLQARYYNPTQGQFISQDPSYLSIGDPNQLKSVTGQEQKQFLMDPQLANSYSYGRDNPLTNKDPDGKYIEVSGSAMIPGRSFSAGLRLDWNGVDFFMGAGTGYGAGGGVELAWAPGVQLSHRREASVSLNAQYAEGVGGRLSQNLFTYDPETRKQLRNGDPVGGIMLGAGGGASVQYELSAPVPGLVWGNPSPRPGSPVPSTLNNKTYISRATQSYQPATQNYSGGSSAGRSSLGETLSSLYSTLSKLSAALGSLINTR
jgi:RHS repeat-associated protein